MPVLAGDPDWQRALPRLVALQAREGLNGIMLRADLANGLPSGTTLRLAARGLGGPIVAANRPASQLLGSAVSLQRLAALLAIDVDELERHTLLHEIQRLLGTETTSVRVVGPEQRFRVCPRCVAEAQLLPIEHALPFVATCERHGVQLVDTGTCGQRLRCFAGASPFTCAGCGEAWRDLPVVTCSRRELLAASRLNHAYTVFLTRGERDFVQRARLVLQMARWPRWRGGDLAPDGMTQPSAQGLAFLASIGRIAKAFADLAIPPERLLEVYPLPEPRRGRCLNEDCEAFGTTDYIRHNGSRNGAWESYCLWCGSRFLGDRIILCFDLDNGDTRLSRTAVIRAQERLDDWRQKLAAVIGDAEARGKHHCDRGWLSRPRPPVGTVGLWLLDQCAATTRPQTDTKITTSMTIATT